MGFRKNRAKEITKLVKIKTIMFLKLAGAATNKEIIKTPNCPVVTGNLRSSNFAEPVDEDSLKVIVRNSASYAVFVEARRQFFSRGLDLAEPTLKKLRQIFKL